MCKKFKRLTQFIILFIGMLLFLPTCTAKAATPKLTQTNLKITVGQTKKLSVKNTTKLPKWSSQKKSVATISKTGMVKGIKAGKTKIIAKVSGKTLSCTVTVGNANAKAEKVSFKNKTGGDFVKGVSKATISFSLNNTSTNVKVKVINSFGNTVYTKTYDKCKENKAYSFDWNGKNNKGKYVSDDFYKLCIIAGTTKTFSKSTHFYTSNDFAGGDGSKSNPYQVKTLAQLKNVNKYNGRNFKQIADIDGDDANFTPLFTQDNPFTGVYDGGGYNISRLFFRSNKTAGIFSSIGEKGTVKNISLKKITFIFHTESNGGGIAAYNYGKIQGCTISDSSTENAIDELENRGNRGGICGKNYGTIQSCSVQSLKIEGTVWDNIGGIVGLNEHESGVVLNCHCKNVILDGGCTGGIVGQNDNQVKQCSLTGECTIDGHNGYEGAITGANDGKIEECYTDTEYELTGY